MKKILIYEPNGLVQELIFNSVKDLPYEIYIAQNSRMFLEFLSKFDWSIIFISNNDAHFSHLLTMARNLALNARLAILLPQEDFADSSVRNLNHVVVKNLEGLSLMGSKIKALIEERRILVSIPHPIYV